MTTTPTPQRDFKGLPAHRTSAPMRAILASLMVAAALTACGGGDPEPADLGQLTVVTTGGRADIAADTLGVAFAGPTVRLAAPAEVLVEIELDWEQSMLAPASLAFSVTVGSTSTPYQSAGAVTTALTRFATTHTVRLSLPAGETTLAGLGRVSATNGAGAAVGALAYYNVQATWRVTSAP